MKIRLRLLVAVAVAEEDVAEEVVAEVVVVEVVEVKEPSKVPKAKSVTTPGIGRVSAKKMAGRLSKSTNSILAIIKTHFKCKVKTKSFKQKVVNPPPPSFPLLRLGGHWRPSTSYCGTNGDPVPPDPFCPPHWRGLRSS